MTFPKIAVNGFGCICRIIAFTAIQDRTERGEL
jgi:hypothetical protein